jgi:hypothetical protein
MSFPEAIKVLSEMEVQVKNGYHVSDDDITNIAQAMSIVTDMFEKVVAGATGETK